MTTFDIILIGAVSLGILGTWFRWPVLSSPLWVPACLAIALVFVFAKAFTS